MKLSILICSVKVRRPLLDRMLRHLNGQILDRNEVEVLVEENKDPMTRGRSRNILVDRAKGAYCAYVDDDDVVSSGYIEKILEAIKKEPEICSITGIVTSLLCHNSHRFVLSTKYPELFTLPSDDLENDTYNRFVSHINPIRTDIIKAVRFPENVFHEDNDYSARLQQYKSEWNETEIEGVLYYYFNKVRISG